MYEGMRDRPASFEISLHDFSISLVCGHTNMLVQRREREREQFLFKRAHTYMCKRRGREESRVR